MKAHSFIDDDQTIFDVICFAFVTCLHFQKKSLALQTQRYREKIECTIDIYGCEAVSKYYGREAVSNTAGCCLVEFSMYTVLKKVATGMLLI